MPENAFDLENLYGSPTRASLLTGKYAARLGFTTAVRGNVRTFYNQGIDPPAGYVAQDAIEWKDKIDIQQALLNGTTRVALASGHPLDRGQNETTLAEAMSDHYSVFIGKWHVGGHGSKGWQPSDQGFEEVSYFDEGGSPYFHWRPLWERRGLVHPNMPQVELRQGTSGANLGQEYLTDELTEQAIKTMPDKAESLFRQLNDWIDAHVDVRYTPALNPNYVPTREARERAFVDLRQQILGESRAVRTAGSDPRLRLLNQAINKPSNQQD